MIRYRARGAVREVGKVMGLTEDVTSALASQLWGWSGDGVTEESARKNSTSISMGSAIAIDARARPGADRFSTAFCQAAPGRICADARSA